MPSPCTADGVVRAAAAPALAAPVPLHFVARRPAGALPALGDAMRRHGRLIRGVQWAIVLAYAVLVVLPAFLPLPDDAARILDHLGLFAQFLFWGIWWPFVLLSMVLLGRVWCGVFCPEGALSEAVSRHGRGRGIPRWMRWGGWPAVAFVITTIYGQLVSVYQYPQAALLVLGGSTVAAVLVGAWVGRGKRVWCRHLCPVGGVFGLLARLAPLHFQVDRARWEARTGGITRLPNCAPLIDIRRMESASACHMCGRCSGQRDAVTLVARVPGSEIVRHGANTASGWDTALLLFGLIGVAMGAFHWGASPGFVALRVALADWAVERGWWWLLLDNAPWWLLTHYPQNQDVFVWLDGLLIVAYILATGLAVGAALYGLCLAGARALARPGAQHHLALAYVPLGGCGAFLGLSMTTVSMLRHEGLAVPWVDGTRALLLAGAALWGLWLAWQSSAVHSQSRTRRALATGLIAVGAGLVVAGWSALFFWW